MADINETREAAIKEAVAFFLGNEADRPTVQEQFGRLYDAGHADATAEMSERVRELEAALAHIRDMPVYDQDDHVRVRNSAKMALEKKR